MTCLSAVLARMYTSSTPYRRALLLDVLIVCGSVPTCLLCNLAALRWQGSRGLVAFVVVEVIDQHLVLG